MNKKYKQISSDQCFVIAEAGSNHNGSFDQAKALIDVAKEAGADAVKFQIFRAKTLYPKQDVKVKYLTKLGINKGLYDLIRSMEMPAHWIEPLASYCKELDIEFMASPFDRAAIRLLNPFVSRFKIASFECFDTDLIEAVKDTGKELLVSIGGSELADVDYMVKNLLKGYESKSILLQCLSRYPAPMNELQLSVVQSLREHYGLRVGYSDHSVDPLLAPVVAVGLGACVIEKHFTLSRALPGPDHSFAIEPDELKAMVNAIRAAVQMRGSPLKKVQKSEQELIYYKRCLYAKASLKKGKSVSKSDFVSLRNTGRKVDSIHPMYFSQVAGKKLIRNKAKSDILCWGDFK